MAIDTKRIANRIRLARIEKGFSQTQVAQLMGKNQSYVSRCESGQKKISIEELASFAGMFGQDLQYFLEIKEQLNG